MNIIKETKELSFKDMQVPFKLLFLRIRDFTFLN